MTDQAEAQSNSAEIRVARIAMWQAVLVAAIGAVAGIISTLIVQKASLKATSVSASTGSPVAAPSKSVPRYTQNADTFLLSPKTVPYKWDGYRQDVQKLNELVKDCLSDLAQHPTDYSEASAFYDDMERAADMVHNRVKEVAYDPATDKPADYNWKLYCAEYLFRLEIQELRTAHKSGPLDAARIEGFKNEFDEWLRHQSGL